MLGLLGTISEVEQTRTGPAGSDYRITFKPAVVLPSRVAPPAWLKDQKLTVDRTVVDVIEAGRPGDSIVLSTQESARWLDPLGIAPADIRGPLPDTLELTLAWSKDETPPACEVTALGFTSTVQWQKTDTGYRATASTAPFARLSPPYAINAACGDMRASCTVLNDGAGSAVETSQAGADKVTLDNEWYRVDVDLNAYAGAIASLVEHGRGLNHFQAPQDLILQDLEYGGQYDRFGTTRNWNESVKKAAVQSLGHRREADAVRLTLDAVLDEGMNLRGPAQITLFDDFPLLLVDRQLMRGKPKDDKDKDKDAPAKEPVDELEAFKYGMRPATLVERGETSGSRVFAGDGSRLYCCRPAPLFDITTFAGLRLTEGWMLVEHPTRKSYLLHMVDPTSAPAFTLWHGAHEMCAEAIWGPVVLLPGRALGFSSAIAAGDLGGATADGAWILCRSRDGKRVAVVARLNQKSESDAESDVRRTVSEAAHDFSRGVPGRQSVTVSLGAESVTASLETVRMPGIGRFQIAVVRFKAAQPNATPKVAFARSTEGN